MKVNNALRTSKSIDKKGTLSDDELSSNILVSCIDIVFIITTDKPTRPFFWRIAVKLMVNIEFGREIDRPFFVETSAHTLTFVPVLLAKYP